MHFDYCEFVQFQKIEMHQNPNADCRDHKNCQDRNFMKVLEVENHHFDT